MNMSYDFFILIPYLSFSDGWHRCDFFFFFLPFFSFF